MLVRGFAKGSCSRGKPGREFRQLPARAAVEESSKFNGKMETQEESSFLLQEAAL
jgi:hypothetical protein